MTRALTLERVLDLVTQVAGPDRIPSGAGADTPLKDGGFWLDSASLLEVIIACEAEFDVVLEPETDFTDQGLATTRSLFTLIRAKRRS
jgi:acyl carrier protein